ncbi:MAG TPA: hypothetical protein VNV15_05000 [Opitutaceae bacterium]|jgi:hypothetical protein|nr:hypothetical protein [Opitutaceae bacterium]
MSENIAPEEKTNRRKERPARRSQISPRDIWGIRVLFGFIGALFLLVTICELVTGKIISRHGLLLADRARSPISYWLLVFLSLLTSIVPFSVVWIASRKRKGRARR